MQQDFSRCDVFFHFILQIFLAVRQLGTNRSCIFYVISLKADRLRFTCIHALLKVRTFSRIRQAFNYLPGYAKHLIPLRIVDLRFIGLEMNS
ncbi:unnamed protein product [Haemonchus placei]|uniref:Uncharacterized protein n=1 Tax=Haemonchus placei TaxID=6290 RepID=A0A3P7WFC0_HAEPC|nr:unnamed protein product [Haemonchus placei]